MKDKTPAKKTITIKDCKPSEDPIKVHHETRDEITWINKDRSGVTIRFPGGTPDLFGEGHAPPSPIPLSAGGSAMRKLADDAKNEGNWPYQIPPCPSPIGPHVIIVNP